MGSSNEGDRRAALLRQAVGIDPSIGPAATEWDKWFLLSRRERMLPALYALSRHNSTDLRPEQWSELQQSLEGAMARCVRLEHHLVRICRRLEEQGIRAVVLKGASTAHLDYDAPSIREFGDVDLLVAPDSMPQAREILEGLGWTKSDILASGHDEIVHAVTHSRDGLEVDMHQHIARRAIGRLVPTKDLLGRAIPVRITGHDLFALDDVDRLIGACIHARGGNGAPSRLTSLSDILAITKRRPRLCNATLDRAESYRVRSVVEHGILNAHATARVELHDVWQAALARAGSKKGAMVRRIYVDAKPRPIQSEIFYIGQLDSWYERFAYVSGMFQIDSMRPFERARYLYAKLGSPLSIQRGIERFRRR